MGDTLVLSTAYEPIDRVSWKRAMQLLVSGLVEVVEEYEDWTVHSVTLEFKVPSVIRWVRGVFRHRKGVKFSRENVYLRDKGKCQYCRKSVPRSKFTFDHVVPQSQGGKTTWENIVVACTPCNQKKANRTPAQARMSLMTEPVRPKSLPDVFNLTLTHPKRVPSSWKNWLRDVSYWHAELMEE